MTDSKKNVLEGTDVEVVFDKTINRWRIKDTGSIVAKKNVREYVPPKTEDATSPQPESDAKAKDSEEKPESSGEVHSSVRKRSTIMKLSLTTVVLALLVIGALTSFFYGWPLNFSGENVRTTTIEAGCPEGYTCTPRSVTVQTRCPAGMDCRYVGTENRKVSAAHDDLPSLSGPAWKQCLERLGILDKCQKRGSEVFCRRSVAAQAAQCGI